MGSGTWQAFSMIFSDGSGETDDPLILINSETASIKLVNNTASAGEFNIVSSSGAIEFNDIWFTGTGSGGWEITGDYEFGEFKVDGASKTLDFLFSPTITATSFNIVGTSEITYTLTSTSSETWTFSKSSGDVECQYLDLSYSFATGGATYYAGYTSTDSGNNFGWFFADVGFSPSSSLSPSPSASRSLSPSASQSPSSSISASISLSPSTSISPSPSVSISLSPSVTPSPSSSPSSSVSSSISPSIPGANTLSVDLFQICFVLVYSDKYSDKTTNYADKYDRKTTNYNDKYEAKTTTYKVKYTRKSC
jgi:hypothetical protein